MKSADIVKLLDNNGWSHAIAGWVRDEAEEGGEVRMHTEDYDPEQPDEGWAGSYSSCGYPDEFYDDFGINRRLVELLDDNGLFAEWINGGEFGVYNA